MGSYGKCGIILLFVVLFAACSGSENTGTQADKKDANAYNEIKSHLSSKKDVIQYNRILGLLSDLLREQKRLFTSKHGNEENKTAAEIEALLNEAAMFGSQRNYEDAFKILDNAHEKVDKSLKEMAPN